MKKVIIIGAGPAGLTTAYELVKQSNYEVIVLEKDSIIGGISKTVKFNDKYLVDTGIHRFFSKNEEINNIWKELLGDELLKKERCTRIFYKKKFFSYPIDLRWDNIKKLGIFTTIKIGFSYIKAQIFKKKENNLENFYINRFGKVLYQMFFEDYTEKVWGIHPSKISADWGSQRVKGISISEILKDSFRKLLKIKDEKNTEVSLIENFYYPKYGAGYMWSKMKDAIEQSNKGKIIANASVFKLEIKESKITKVRYIKDNKEFSIDADIVISSMPIKDLINSFDNSDNVPKRVFEISNQLPYREFISICMVVKKIKLKDTNGIIKDNWIYIQDSDVKVGRMQIFNNWSKDLFINGNENNNVLISLEYFCSEGDKYWNMTEEEFISLAEKEAIKVGIIDKGDLIEAKQLKIEKAYPAYFGVYEQISEVIDYLNTIENLYCIGRNGQHRYNNMDHSMLTGIETAKNIIFNKKSKEDIWKVNTEKKYHEIKQLEESK